jgi:hypothetical protein
MLGTASTAVTAGIVCGPVGTRVPSNAADRRSTRAEATRGKAGADVQTLAASNVFELLVISMRVTPFAVSGRAETRR